MIKVEHLTGDDVRRMGVRHVDSSGRHTGETSSFLAMNRGKRSIALDLARPEAREVMLRLIDGADVLIENFKVGTLERFGFDYATVAARNPRLVYCSITGFGQDGPMSRQPGYDPIFQAMSGLLSVTGAQDGTPGAGPALVGYSISDIPGGQYAVAAILAALNHRDMVSGEGQFIDIALLDTQIHAASHMAMNYLSSGRLPRRNGTASQVTCPWQAFDCADKPIMIAVGNDAQFRRFATLLGLPELAEDRRYATNLARVDNAATLIPRLTDALMRDTAASWFERLDEAGIPSGPLNTFAEAFETQQVRHRDLLRRLDHPTAGSVRYVANATRMSGTEFGATRPPPLLAEHTGEILAELGMSAEEIAAIRQSGAAA